MEWLIPLLTEFAINDRLEGCVVVFCPMSCNRGRQKGLKRSSILQVSVREFLSNSLITSNGHIQNMNQIFFYGNTYFSL